MADSNVVARGRDYARLLHDGVATLRLCGPTDLETAAKENTMRISTLFVLVSMTTAIACGGDDGGDDTASTDPTTSAGPTTEPTTSMTAATMTTDATESGSTETVDPDSGSSSDPTEDPTTGDPDTGTETTTGEPAGECAGYCTAFLATCQDAEGAGLDGADPYVDEADCLAQCEGFVVDDGTAMGGNDLECRLYHVGVAAVMADMGHCGHADVDGTGVCA